MKEASVDSELPALVRQCQDLSLASSEIDAIVTDEVSKFAFDASLAGYLAGVETETDAKVLVLNTGGGQTARYFGESGISVHALEEDDLLRTIATERVRDLPNVTVASKPRSGQGDNAPYDLVLVNGGPFKIGPADALAPTVSETETFFSYVFDQCSATGAVVVAGLDCTCFGQKHATSDYRGEANGPIASPRGRHRSSMIHPVWIANAASSADFCCVEEFFAYPSFLDCQTVLRRGYLETLNYPQNHWPAPGTDIDRDAGHLTFSERQFRILIHSGEIEGIRESFVYAFSREAAPLASITPFDFVYLPSALRKEQYRSRTEKRRDDDTVVKVTTARHVRSESGLVTQVPLREKHVDAPRLSYAWRDLLVEQDIQKFRDSLGAYFRYTSEHARSNPTPIAFDLNADNIAITRENEYRLLDQEWRVDLDLLPRFLFTRGIFYFACQNQPLLASLAGHFEDEISIGGFIRWCYLLLGESFEGATEEFVALERRIQAEILAEPIRESFESLLHRRLDTPTRVIAYLHGSGDDMARLGDGISAGVTGAAEETLEFRCSSSVSGMRGFTLGVTRAPRTISVESIAIRGGKAGEAGSEVLRVQGIEALNVISDRFRCGVVEQGRNGVFIFEDVKSLVQFETPSLANTEVSGVSISIQAGETGPEFCKNFATHYRSIIDEKDRVIKRLGDQLDQHHQTVIPRLKSVENELQVIKTSKTWKLLRHFMRKNPG